jgi:tetratricopeptide (TPR) repeat protein
MVELPEIREVWDFEHPAESQIRFEELIPLAEAASDHGYLLELQTQIARALGLQGRFEEAHARLDLVEAALDAEDAVARLRLLLERGRVFNSSGSPERALPLFEEAWDLGRQMPNHDLAVDAAHMVAIVAPPEQKRSWNERAVEYAERSGDGDAARWLGSLFNNMGWDAHDAGDYQEALRLHEKCWAWHQVYRPGQYERVAKWSVAKQLRFLNRNEEALAMQQELLEEYARDEPGGEGLVHEEIGELLQRLGRSGS